MSGTQGMQGGMAPMNAQPYGQPMAQPGQMPGQMPQAVPNAQMGGQMPVGMAPNPYQYGAPQTAQYVQNQAQMRMPNKPV